MSNIDMKNFSDRFGTKDRIVDHGGLVGVVEASYDCTFDPVTGLSQLGEIIFRKHNQILMGGSLYGLEKMFDVPSSLTVEYLNNILGCGLTGPQITDRYPKDNKICLWTIGNGGAGASIDDVNAVLQQHRQLMGQIPFRVVDAPFEEGSDEASKYYLMKRTDDGKYAYYAKTFEKDPVISALWKDAGDDKDGSPVVESDYNSTRTTPIETFAEVVLRLETVDLREYYNLYQAVAGTPRFNTFGLCSGIKSTEEDGRPEYKQVLQVSGLSFSNEPLHMEKDLFIRYRFYTK